MTPIDTATNTAGHADPGRHAPAGIAITPDGKTAYVANASTASVTPIDTATNTRGPPIPVGSDPLGDRDHPGRQDRLRRQPAAPGTVTPIDTATNTAGHADPGRPPRSSGRDHPGRQDRLRHQRRFSNTVTPIDTATNTPGTPIPVGGIPYAIAITPDGKTAYVTNATLEHGDPDRHRHEHAGHGDPRRRPSRGGSRSPRIRGRWRRSRRRSRRRGRRRALTRRRRRDPDGTVVSYHWDFGDGTSQTTPSATTAHTYATPNTYTVTLTVTDDAGCSTALFSPARPRHATPDRRRRPRDS